MSEYYILDGKEAVPCDVMTWARWYEKAGNERVVANDKAPDGTHVSTVFLGSDHAFGQGEKPHIFETMVFGGECDQEQERYATWDEAEAGHARWLALVSESQA